VGWAEGARLDGYEIHMGRTERDAAARPAVTITRRGAHPDTRDDGCVSADGQIWGCYLHGLFANDAFRRAWLRTLGWQEVVDEPSFDPYDRLADALETHLDRERLAELLEV
jgi:adenosylcobyric acid synthase